ncbi:MAG: hypothetical protein NVS1B4_10010 [Gemmatimonadaceae bacterium]
MTDSATFQAAAFTARGTKREAVTLPSATFDGTVNMPVMHQAVKAYMANQRQGNAATKTRSFVIGGNQKPWKQKGTGRARQGSIRAPHWVGGGTAFGPQPRSYAQYVPRQVRALARKSAFNARAREEAIYVVDAFNYETPKTSLVAQLLERMSLAGKKVLILSNGLNTNLYLSTRNLADVQALPYQDVSTYHILWSDVVLIESGALGETLAPVADEEPAPRVKAAKAAKKAASVTKTKASPGKARVKATAAAPKKSGAKSGSKRAAKKAVTGGRSTAAKGEGGSKNKAKPSRGTKGAPAAKRSSKKKGK